MRAVIVATLLTGFLGGAATAQTAPVDWGEALRQDAQEIHDIIAVSHPGPVDAENPGFRALLERGLETAVERSRAATSYEDWYFGLQQYAASFDDAHLTLTGIQPNPSGWRAYWPGFLTTQRGDVNLVSFNRDDLAPPVGAELVSCDDRAADQLAAEFVGVNVGRWNLKARRQIFAGTLFIDQTNPYVSRPSRCVFEVEGASLTYDLVWRDLPNDVRDEGLAAGHDAAFTAPIELRDFGANSAWIGLGSFDSTAGGPEAAALQNLTTQVLAEVERLRTKDVLVFDLRGNQGGSSTWISDLAVALWGEDWVKEKVRRSQGVDWRASQGNLEEIASYRDQMADSPTLTAWVDEVEGGLRQARADGEELWRQGGPRSEPTSSASTPMKSRVYVFTDYGCVSACLDAVDILTALGAVHVGQETSADTLYMNAREQKLSSGRLSIVVPMKVYRGRARGSNVPAVPTETWTGALSDTGGIEAWITELADAR